MNIFNYAKRAKIEAFEEKIAGLETALFESQNEVLNLQKELDEAKNVAKNLTEEKVELATEVESTESKLEETAEKLVEVEAELEEAKKETHEFEEAVAKKAQETLASIGHVSLEVEAESSTEPLMDVVAQFKKLKGAAAVAFYNENKKEINKSLNK